MDLNLPTERQYEIWRGMSMEEKYQVFLSLMRTIRELKRAGVKMLHPDWDDEMVEKEVARIYLNTVS